MNALASLVVGIDGSEVSAQALRWAARHVTDGESLHVVHSLGGSTLRGPVRSTGAPGAQVSALLENEWTEQARAAGHEPQTHLVEGPADDALRAVAEDVGAEAIVVGAHGTGESSLLGSVTRGLLHDADRPVVIAKPEATAASEARVSDRTIVACVGYGKASDHAAEWAAAYAARHDLALHLLHVVGVRPMFPSDSPVDTVASYLGPEVSLDWAKSDLEGLAKRLGREHPDLVVDTEVELGSAVHTIADATVGADLVVLGKRHRGKLSKHIIGPRLHRLIVRIPAPVAVVPLCQNE